MSEERGRHNLYYAPFTLNKEIEKNVKKIKHKTYTYKNKQNGC